MKKTISISGALAILTATLPACVKPSISSDKLNFVGVWTPVHSSADNVYQITINADGTGSYSHTKPGSTVEFKGNVYFQGITEMTIGGRLIHKKIKITEPARKIVENLKPYTFHYEAMFDGMTYTRPN